METKTKRNHAAVLTNPFPFFIAAIFIFFLAGCVTPSGKSGPRAVSLEEAKKITATFEGQAFTPPPRSINDITKILKQEKPGDLKSYQESLAFVDSEPPATKDPLDLANFYLKRGHAALEVGRSKQEIQDYRLAVKYGKTKRFRCLPQALWGLGSAELRGGNWTRGIEILERMVKKGRDRANRSINNALLSNVYVDMGDLSSGEKALAWAERIQSRWRGRNPVRGAKMDTIIAWSRGDLLDAMGKPAQAESYRRKALASWEPYKNAPTNPCLAKTRHFQLYNQSLKGLAMNLRLQGRLVEAEIYARRAVRGALQALGRYSTFTSLMIAELNRVIFEQGRLQRQRPWRGQTWIYTKGPGRPRTLSCWPLLVPSWPMPY